MLECEGEYWRHGDGSTLLCLNFTLSCAWGTTHHEVSNGNKVANIMTFEMETKMLDDGSHMHACQSKRQESLKREENKEYNT